MDILCAAYQSKVTGGAVGFFGILLILLGNAFSGAAIVTFPCRVLKGEVDIEVVFLVGREIIVAQATAVDVMFDLFGDISLVSGKFRRFPPRRNSLIP